MVKMGSASPATYLGDLNEVYKDDRKILQRRNREEVMKSYLILDDQLMQLYCNPRKIITSADAEPQAEINAIGVAANLQFLSTPASLFAIFDIQCIKNLQ
jgi:hypothetical protein